MAVRFAFVFSSECRHALLTRTCCCRSIVSCRPDGRLRRVLLFRCFCCGFAISSAGCRHEQQLFEFEHSRSIGLGLGFDHGRSGDCHAQPFRDCHFGSAGSNILAFPFGAEATAFSRTRSRSRQPARSRFRTRSPFGSVSHQRLQAGSFRFCSPGGGVCPSCAVIFFRFFIYFLPP